MSGCCDGQTGTERDDTSRVGTIWGLSAAPEDQLIDLFWCDLGAIEQVSGTATSEFIDRDLP